MLSAAVNNVVISRWKLIPRLTPTELFRQVLIAKRLLDPTGRAAMAAGYSPSNDDVVSRLVELAHQSRK